MPQPAIANPLDLGAFLARLLFDAILAIMDIVIRLAAHRAAWIGKARAMSGAPVRRPSAPAADPGFSRIYAKRPTEKRRLFLIGIHPRPG
jgi:hypothetical protein